MPQDHPRLFEQKAQPSASKAVGDTRLQPSIYLESTVSEQLGWLPGEERLVKDVMSSALTVASPQTSVREATTLMKDLGVPVIIVYDGARLVGLLTDRDVALSRMTGGSVGDTSIKSIMQTGVPSCGETDRLGYAFSLMRIGGVDWLPVLDQHDQVVGVLSRYAAR
jgi:CBS domain-containing protein